MGGGNCPARIWGKLAHILAGMTRGEVIQRRFLTGASTERLIREFGAKMFFCKALFRNIY